MHRFWAAAFPGDYKRFEYEEGWVKTYCKEIDWAMHKADQFLGRLAKFVDRNPDYQIWVCTSMGQAATVARPMKTELFVTDMAAFLRTLGVGPGEWKEVPAMLPRYTLRIAPHKVKPLRDSLARLVIKGRPVRFEEAAHGFFMIHLGHPDLQDDGAQLGGRYVPFGQMGLGHVPIDDAIGSTAYHIPQGCLFIYDPAGAETPAGWPQVSTLEIAPTILKNFSVRAPSYMRPALQLN
jgi:hypothetical protein